MVFTTAARLTGNDAQAEDIAQEVFLKAYESFEMLRTSERAGGWLKTVTTNLTLNHLSRYRKRWRFFSELRQQDTDETETDIAAMLPQLVVPDTLFAGLDAAERSRVVEQALKQLPQHQRLPLVLHHFDEMPYQEIARHLKVSLPKVKTDILRGRLALAKILAGSDLAAEHVAG